MTLPSLLLRHDKAGDAIKSLPALRALRAALPLEPLHLLVSRHNASLFEKEPGFTVHVLPSHWAMLKPEVLLAHLQQNGLPVGFSRVVSLLADAFEETDHLLELFPATEKYAAAIVDSKLISVVRRLPLKRQTPRGQSETLNIAEFLSTAFGTNLLASVSQYSRAPVLLDQDLHEAESLMGKKNGPWLGFCPFAGLKNRSHPLARWEAFLKQATRSPFVEKFFLLGSPDDCAALEKLQSICYHPQKTQLCFPSTFRTLGAYLKRLDGVVAVDSGPLHLAQALDVRSLGILSGGDAQRWFSSLNPGDQILRRGWVQRFPTSLEMTWAFRRWLRHLPVVECL